MTFLRDFFTGFLIGLANLIPGVSGGTFALILGVYERLITFLNRIGLRRMLIAARLVRRWFASGFNRERGREFFAHLRENDYPFMTILLLGTLSCILSMSSVMKYLLLNHFTATYAYFFGLIVLSILVPWRMLKRPRTTLVIPALIGILLTVGVTVAVNPYDKAVSKSELLKVQFEQQAGGENSGEGQAPLSYTGKYSAGEFVYIFFCGTIAISAMVLPGISGSLVLILMGQYFTVISAIANLRALLLDDLLFLGCMATGIVFGLISFARVIEFAFRRFHDPVMSFLTGLIIGSLYSLWPFKEAHLLETFYVKEGPQIEMLRDYTVYSNVNILPQDGASLATALMATLAGIITMLLFLRQDTAAASKHQA